MRCIQTAAAMLLAVGIAAGQEGVQQATIRKIDPDGMIIVLKVDKQDKTYHLMEGTVVGGAKAKSLRERLSGLREGSPVQFKAVTKDGKDYVVALRLAQKPGVGGKPAQIKPADTSKLLPLTELGEQKYQGFQGGLYPGGKNEPPAEHAQAGLALAKQVQPLDAQGQPSPNGKIVLLSIGMSNTNQASQGFERHLAKADDINPRFLFVNGAQGGMTAARIQDRNSQSGELYWSTVEKRLKQAGVTPAQVQVVWIKQADAGPSSGFPAYAKQLQAELARIVQLLPERFPNCKLAYLSGRTYGGFATTKLNPEPYAYESGFSVKWLIEDQIKGEPSLNHDAKRGPVKAPWLSWGPQLWANGETKRADGFYYTKEDFREDGTHHSPAGMNKIGGAVMDFFRSQATTRPWFLKSGRK
jgi:hypothetical protein